LENSIFILLFASVPKKDRKRGEYQIRPAFAPVLRVRLMQPIKRAYLKSGRQNLAALGTTTGQNLAAVGSSHSLTETVDLGTVAAAGLVGTLHTDTPPMMKFYAQYRTSRHSNPCFYLLRHSRTDVL
jgi:hypothetical protein